MTEIDIDLPDVEPTATIIARIDAAIALLGLTVTMKASVKAYPGSTHWHCKRGREKGTLEITFWPARKRLWIKVQSSRRAAWMDDIVPRLKTALER